MSDPTVCCVLLVDGRAAMVRRAIASFRAQTYENKALAILDTGGDRSISSKELVGLRCCIDWRPDLASHTIGWLRNRAIGTLSAPDDHLMAHFDSDDYSHPRRLEEQVALLMDSGKQCVGYRELLFWDTRTAEYGWSRGGLTAVSGPRNEAWIYRNHQANWAAGASLMYRRELWERQPFDDAPHEDQRWMMTPAVSAECVGMSSILRGGLCDGEVTDIPQPKPGGPRMICQMHGDGTEQISRQVMQGNPDVWRRAEEFDAHCERTMRL